MAFFNGVNAISVCSSSVSCCEEPPHPFLCHFFTQHACERTQSSQLACSCLFWVPAICRVFSTASSGLRVDVSASRWFKVLWGFLKVWGGTLQGPPAARTADSENKWQKLNSWNKGWSLFYLQQLKWAYTGAAHKIKNIKKYFSFPTI